MNKINLLWRLGFLLLALGILLRYIIANFPSWAVAIIHLSAIACLVMYFHQRQKYKK